MCVQEFTSISPSFSYPPHNYQASLRSKEHLSVVASCFLLTPGGLVRGMIDSYEPARNIGVTLLTSQLAVRRNSNSAQLLCASNIQQETVKTASVPTYIQNQTHDESMMKTTRDRGVRCTGNTKVTTKMWEDQNEKNHRVTRYTNTDKWHTDVQIRTTRQFSSIHKRKSLATNYFIHCIDHKS